MKDYYSLANQQSRNQKNIQFIEDKNKFKKLLKNPNFKVYPKWQLEKKNIDFKYLKTDCHNQINKPEDYSLFCVDVIELFNILIPSYLKKFTNEKIWKHSKEKITRILRNWDNNKKLIPIILIFNGTKEKMLIYDGNNRFAVLNYFKVKKIPIIILKKDEIDFKNIINNNKIKKIE